MIASSKSMIIILSASLAAYGGRHDSGDSGKPVR
jgi:hypothetical protein